MTPSSVERSQDARSAESLRPLIDRQRIVFGCGRLHHLSSPERRERLLRTAIDGGLRELDVAPAYGNGLCERAVGRVLRSAHRDIQVNTKVGIPVWSYPRIADRAFPILRALDVISGTHARAYARRDFSPTTLRTSLEQSLKRLGISRVETFFLHAPMSALPQAQWLDVVETMGRLREAGKIRSWGIAGPTADYDLEHLQSEIPFVVQQPFAELSGVAPAGSIEQRLAFAIFAAFRKAPNAGTFKDFIERAAVRHPETKFIVATLDSARLARWIGERHS